MEVHIGGRTMFRALLAALFVGSLSLGFVGCGEEAAPVDKKKETKIEKAVDKAVDKAVEKAIDKAVEKEETK